MNVGIYTRVSSEKQVLEGKSLEWQEHDLMKYAEEHNLNVVEKYIEKGISGDKLETRPQMLRLLKDIKNKKIDNVLVYKVDRLGRETLTNAIICKVLIDNDCILTTSAYGIMELNKAYGGLMYNILSAISQFEVNNLSERVSNGKKQRVRNGLYLNSNSVYGYDNYHDTYSGRRLLKVNDYESMIVNKIYTMYLDGYSMNEIKNYLIKNNIKTKRGGKWCQSTIYQILTNRLYIGKVVYKGNRKNEAFEHDGIHQAIVDNNLFEKVNEIIEKRKRQNIKKSSKEYSYFSSVLKCMYCNSTLKPKQTKSKDKTSIRYYCNNKNCVLNSIRHTELEKRFINQLSSININFDEKVVKKFCSNDDYDIITNSLNNIKRNDTDLSELFSNNLINEDLYVERLKVNDNKRKTLLEKQEELKNKIIVYDEKVKNQIINLLNQGLSNNYIKLSNIDRMNFINQFIDEILIDNDTINIRWKTKNNEFNIR